MKKFEVYSDTFRFFLIYIMIVHTLSYLVSCKPGSSRVYYPVEDSLMEADKRIITQKFVKNVEYFRKYHIFNPEDYTKEELEAHYQKYPCAKTDPANFFIFYSRRQIHDGEFVASPFPTETQIVVNTDSIIYNCDATLCIAFISIERNFDKIKGLIPSDSIQKYDAVAVVGYRPSEKDTIDIYPLTNLSVYSFEKREYAVRYIVTHYTKYLSHWRIWGKDEPARDFSYNLGEEYFFDDYIFKQYDDTTYGFQVYHHWDKYNSCRYNYKY